LFFGDNARPGNGIFSYFLPVRLFLPKNYRQLSQQSATYGCKWRLKLFFKRDESTKYPKISAIYFFEGFGALAMQGVPNWGAMFTGHGGGRTDLHRDDATKMRVRTVKGRSVKTGGT